MRGRKVRERMMKRLGQGLLRGWLALFVLALLPAAGWAQETQPEGAAPDSIGEPEMAKAPLQFRLAGTFGSFLWGEKEGVVKLDNLVNFGIDLESRIVPAVAFRFGGSYGSTTASDDTASIGVNQWEFNVALVGRLAIAPLRRSGFVPFGLVAAGTIALDPRSDPDDPDEADLVTRSQGAFSFGGGLDIEPGSGRWGGRVEYRHYRVSLEDPFNPVDRTGDTIGGNLIMASIFWKL